MALIPAFALAGCDNDWPGNGRDSWTSPAPGYPASIVFGTHHGLLMSIEASDGTLNKDFGASGIVNLKTPEVLTAGMDLSCTPHSPLVFYKNLTITGAGAGEGPGGSEGGAGMSSQRRCRRTPGAATVSTQARPGSRCLRGAGRRHEPGRALVAARI